MAFGIFKLLDRLRCQNCKDNYPATNDHQCLFDPPYRYCDCSICFSKPEPFTMEMEINLINGLER